MYEKNDILDLETGILSIYTCYSYIQINFNNYLKNGNKDISDVNKSVEKAKLVIGELRSLLFELTPIKYPNKTIDYELVAKQLFYLGSLSRKHKLHTNKIIWDSVTDIVERSSFSAVFGHLISRLRTLEKKFSIIPDKYSTLSFTKAKEFKEDLLNLNTYLQDFISYVQVVKIMLDYVDKNQLFAMASREKNFTKPKKEKPVLRLIKNNKINTNNQ